MSRFGSKDSSRRRPSSRTTVVWAVFVTAMTGLAGLLLLSDPPPQAGADIPATRPFLSDGNGTTSENMNDGADSVGGESRIEADRWQSIVIHHSGRMTGTVRELDGRAKQAGLNGLGYHFVIGNGSGLSDGVVESGYRWQDQSPGAHVAISPGAGDAEWKRANDLNRTSVGICLIGNGNRQPFTEAQIRALIDLVRGLQRECDIPASRVLLHSDVFSGDDPGRYFPTDRLESHILP